MDDKITIIEGPPPSFETVDDGWATGLTECSELFDLAVTRLRTFNGPALVERCHRAWSDQSAMFLHYKNPLGLEERAPIAAARSVETGDGHVLLLWIRRPPEESEAQFDPDDDEDDDENEF
jgi:hypothetical protein